MKKHTVLIVVGHYLPGYKAGGPTRTISNLVAWLGDEFDFRIVTQDRDLGDDMPYEGIVPNSWQQVGKSAVMYRSSRRSLLAWLRLLNQVEYDLLYLNSFFDLWSIQSVLLWRLRLISPAPIIIAPRGELSEGALALKATKKGLYIKLAKTLNFHRNVCWQASSEYEAANILRVLAPREASSLTVRIAPNMPPPIILDDDYRPQISKPSGQARLVFVGRIARMKNLSFALDVLAGVSGDIKFDIFGPVEDEAYWRECQKRIERLPSSIQVRFHGPIPNERLIGVFESAHLFFSPTLGENFGHAILEALSVGCPVLISDRTPWRHLAREGAGWDLPLEQSDQFVDVLNQVVRMRVDEWRNWALGAKQLAARYREDAVNLNANRRLFMDAIESRARTRGVHSALV